MLLVSVCLPISLVIVFTIIFKICVSNMYIIFPFGSDIPLLLEILQFCKKNLNRFCSAFSNLFTKLKYLYWYKSSWNKGENNLQIFSNLTEIWWFLVCHSYTIIDISILEIVLKSRNKTHIDIFVKSCKISRSKGMADPNVKIIYKFVI